MKKSRPFEARYPGKCGNCGSKFSAGTKVAYGDRGIGHVGCLPTGVDKAADREFQDGLDEGRRYSDDVKRYGREMAEQWEMEAEIVRGYW